MSGTIKLTKSFTPTSSCAARISPIKRPKPLLFKISKAKTSLFKSKLSNLNISSALFIDGDVVYKNIILKQLY